MNSRQLLRRLSQGAVHNVAFDDLIGLLEGLGFRIVRTTGRHHIFSRPGVPEMINIQPVRGEAKPYQIRQVLRLVERYDLQLED